MQRRSPPEIRAVVLASLLTLVAGCTPHSPVLLTAADNGRIFILEDGEQVHVALEANRSTGYGWTFVDSPPSVVAAVGEPTYKQAVAAAGMVGTGGTETWTLRANGKGEQTIRFEYRRPWETGPPARIVTFKVHVE